MTLINEGLYSIIDIVLDAKSLISDIYYQQGLWNTYVPQKAIQKEKNQEKILVSYVY